LAGRSRQVFVPETPVDLPVGCVLDIPLPSPERSQEADKPLLKLARKLEQFATNPEWPPDGAAQHDHYLYGTPKKP